MQKGQPEQMTKVRRTQEQRRRGTQDAILDAVIELLLERGYAAMTAVDVAERAGVSRGAQAHYFRTKLDLAIASARRAMKSAIEAAETMAEAAKQSDDVIDGFIEQSRRFFLEPYYIAMIDILLVGRTDLALSKDYSKLIIETRTRLEAIWLSVFHHAGMSDEGAHMLLTMTHHMMRGMAMSTLWRAEPKEMQAVIEHWTHIAENIMRNDLAAQKRGAGEKRRAVSKGKR